ncbi:AlpA family transcriptional regulator [Ralstonia pseudosolanacearum]|uniref:helix-turn-helix transcriptional regulator n=1 Tax=Ralstonia pseudosolanacearum TaxID=1310165 RepID=UPI00270FF12C|nr:AlpA family transcriptional regulator [Ralstonia pseudosolanacearum]MDO3618800.1 AlpA family transcriptional regulator [Ralstonia pseudosolanacearum]
METANRILRIKQVMEITGLAKPTIYLHMKQGTFPRQIKLGPKAAGWLQADVQAWINSRIAASRVQ